MKLPSVVAAIALLLLIGCSDGEVVGERNPADEVAISDLEPTGLIPSATEEFVRKSGIAPGDTVRVLGLFSSERLPSASDDDAVSYFLDSTRIVIQPNNDGRSPDPYWIQYLDVDTQGRPLFRFLDVRLAGEIVPDFRGTASLCSLVVLDTTANPRRSSPTWHRRTFQTRFGNLTVTPDPAAYDTVNFGILGPPGAADVYAEFNGKRSRLITGVRLVQYNLIDVKWVGDLDDDNIPDLIMDYGAGTGFHYYLSSLARDGQLFGLAAKQTTHGC